MTDLRYRGEDGEEEPPEPRSVRRLRLLVSTLMIVLITGMITVAGALVIRLGLGGPEAAAPGLPAPVAADGISLPEGAEIRAIGRAGREILVVTRDAAGAEHLRAFDAATGAQRSVTPVRRRPGSGG